MHTTSSFLCSLEGIKEQNPIMNEKDARTERLERAFLSLEKRMGTIENLIKIVAIVAME